VGDREEGYIAPGQKTMVNEVASEAAAVVKAARMESHVNTGTVLMETTKAPIYLCRILRMRAAVVLGTMPET
jgi:hypothetical protein